MNTTTNELAPIMLDDLRNMTEQKRQEADLVVQEANNLIMSGESSSAPGGMQYQFSSESWGGNAGTMRLDGVNLTKAAANCLVDAETGEIITFTNNPEDQKRLSEAGHKVVQVSILQAIPRMRIKDETIKFDRVAGWSRPDSIVDVFWPRRGEGRDEMTRRAAKNLLTSVATYNEIEQPFVVGPSAI